MTVPRHGVLIMGSGNLVHNLHAYAWGRHRRDPYEWAVRFETQAKEMMLAGQYQTLLPAGRGMRSLFLSKVWMAALSRCWRYRSDS
jgi:aromatic ring-opening dioxygenase catalytic subunit (LigB family)